MRIIIDLQSCQNGSRHRGIGRYSLALAQAIVSERRGHEYLLLVNDRFPGTLAEIRAAFAGLLPTTSIIVFTTPDRTTSADPRNAWRCRAAELIRAEIIDRLQPDAVLIPSPIEGLWDNFVISIEPRSYINAVTVHDLIPLTMPEQHMSSPDDRAAYLRKVQGLLHADIILSPSEFVRDEVIRELGIARDRVVVTGEGAEQKFSPGLPTPERRAELFARFGINRPFVLNSSPLEYRKNLEGLIAGFGLLPRAIRDRHQLVVIGKMDDYGTSYLDRLAAAEDLKDGDLILTGRVSDEDMIDLYRCCAVFAFPSISEGFGLPALEAIQCGALTIGSSLSSIPEVIGREDCLFDPLEPGEIASAMRRALTDTAWSAAARADQARHGTTLNWPAAARSTLDAIEREAARRTRPEPARRSEAARARPRLALVHAAHPPASRKAGHLDTLLRSLDGHYDVVPVSIGTGDRPQWRETRYTTRDRAWLDREGATTDRVVYVGDRPDLTMLMPVLSDHPGSLILLDDFPSARRDRYGPEAYRREKARDLFTTKGMVGAGQAFAHPSDAFGADLLMLADGLLIEGGTDADRIAGIPPLPATAYGFETKDLRDVLEIPAGAPVVLAHITNDRSATQIVHAFRASEEATATGAHLVLLSGAPASSDPQLVGRGAGRIQRKSVAEYDHYRRYLAMAEIIYVDPTLRDADRTWFTLDARSMGKGILTTPESTALDALLSRETGGGAYNPAPAADGGRLHRAIEGFHAASQHTRHMSLVETLPTKVGNAAPSSHDLTEVAIAMAENEAIDRAPRCFLDLTGLILPDGTFAPDRRSRTAIAGALAADPAIEPVIARGSRFTTARRLVAPLLGLPGDALDDSPIALRSGDRILALDVLEIFPDPARAAYLHAADRGASFDAVLLGGLLDEAQADATGLIEKALTRIKADAGRDGRMMIDAGMPNRSGIAPFPDGYRRLEAMRGAGLAPNIMALDGNSPIAQGIAAALTTLETLPAATDEAQPVAIPVRYAVAGHVLGSYSLAIVNRAVAGAIEHYQPGQVRLLPIETDPVSDLGHMPADERSLMEELASRPRAAGAEVVISQHYPVHVPQAEPGTRRIALFAHEESRIIPAVADVLNAGFDAVLAPSRYVAKSLIDSGVRIPVAAAGQPSDVLRYRDLPRANDPRITTFLHISSCFPRKGPDALLAAWAKAFRRTDRVRLIIKTFPNPHNEIEQMVAALRAQQPNLASIEILNEDLDKAGMERLYAQADAVVLPTRGEGYNLPALEAMLARVSVIVTGQGGHLDFCGPEEARFVAFRLEPSKSHVRSALSLWAEPDVDDLARAFREQADPAYREKIATRIERAYGRALATADQAAWYQRLDRLSRDLLKDRTTTPPRIAWITTWEVRCGIAQHSEFLFEKLLADRRANYRILCDLRTVASDPEDYVRPVWTTGEVPQRDILAQEIEAFSADAVVIQHQDGLISWAELERIANDPRFNQRVLVLVLHNPRAIVHLNDEERAALTEALRRASRLIVHNVSDVNLMISLGLGENVTMLPPGAIPARSHPDVALLPHDGAGPLIGCHGFAFPHKGIDRLIRAAALLRKTWPNLRLRLVTAQFPSDLSRDTVADLRRLAVSLGLADAIEWHTEFLPVDTIIDLLSGCDLLVLPYDQSQDSASGAARICLSSLAPTLATKVKIFEEMQHAFGGVESNDPDTLARAIHSLLDDPEARTDIQKRMAQWLTDFDWDRMMDLMEGMIAGLVEQRRMGWA